MRRFRHSNPKSPFFGIRSLRRLPSISVVLISSAYASLISAQMVAPPETVWGDIEHRPEGLQIGGADLLAGLLIGLTLALGLCAFLAFRHRNLYGRGDELFELRRLRAILAWCAFGATPLLGLATIVLGASHLLFGVEVALLGVALSLPTILIGSATLFAEPA